MKSRHQFVFIALICSCFLLTGQALAQIEPTTVEEEKDPMAALRETLTGLGEDEVNVVSRGATEVNGDWMVLREDAEVNIGGSKSILADLIEYNNKENLVRARGNVVLIENKMRIGCDELQLNLTDNTGYLLNPFIETEEGYLISGSRLDKISADEYEIHDSAITSCNQPRPNWNMAASKIHIKSGDYASLNNFRLRVADALPVFYLPWMRIPFDRERATGFMIPEFGNSEYHGNWISGKFFWAINDSHDATVGADYYEERGVRWIGEYRNNLGKGNVTYARWEFIDDDTWPRDRFNAVIANRTKLPLGFAVNANIEFISDNLYKRDFFNRNTYQSPYFKKSLFLTNNTDGFSFVAGWSDLDRFRNRNNIDQIRYLPSVSLSTRDRQVLETPLYFNFNVQYDRPFFRKIFRRVQFDKEDVIEEKELQRYIAGGEVKMPIKAFAPWLTFTPAVRANYAYYTHQWNPARSDFIEESIQRDFLDFELSATGPVISKVYGDASTEGLMFKHVITPSFNYLYRTDLDFEDKANLIILDRNDTIYRIHEVKWSVDNTVYMKEVSDDRRARNQVYELFRFGVSQYVSVEDDLLTTFDRRYVFNPSTTLATSRYSPLLFDVGVRLYNYVYVKSNLEYDTDESEFNNMSIGASLNTPILSAGVNYYRTVGAVRFIQGNAVRSNANRIVSRGSLNLLDGTFRINGFMDYDITREEVRSYLASVDFNSQCFGLKFELLRLNQFGQDDTQTRLSIVLGGLGGILGGGDDR